MGYYDFSEVVDQLEDLNSTNSDIYTLLYEIREDQKLDHKSIESLASGLNTLTVLLVISIAIGVFFR